MAGTEAMLLTVRYVFTIAAAVGILVPRYADVQYTPGLLAALMVVGGEFSKRTSGKQPNQPRARSQWTTKASCLLDASIPVRDATLNRRLGERDRRETMTDDPWDLRRFVEAQDPVIDNVKEELRAGRKRTHWMWYIFPQMEGLGRSRMAQRYAISSRDEANAYLAHPTLGPRLRECTALVNGVEGRSANEIFGSPDDLKFRSSMTLFDAVADDPAPFRTALERYYGGEPDAKTLELIEEP